MTTIAEYIRARRHIIKRFGELNLWNVNELYAQLIKVPPPTNLVDVPIEVLYEEEYNLGETVFFTFAQSHVPEYKILLEPLTRQIAGVPGNVAQILNHASEELTTNIIRELRAIAISDAPDAERLAAITSLTERYSTELLWFIVLYKKRTIYTDSKPLTERKIDIHFPGDPRYAHDDWGDFFMYKFLERLPGMIRVNDKGDEIVAELEEDEESFRLTVFSVSNVDMEGFNALVQQCREGMTKIRAEKVDKNDDE
jgi:hypothetical protein